jgi:hypothetical protein
MPKAKIPTEPPFNPLEKRHLAESIAEKVLARDALRFPLKAFNGAGVYAIYYVGPFDLYKPVSNLNQGDLFGKPIYVGSAVPSGSRKGGFGLGAAPGKKLHARLSQHAKSIDQAENLTLNDFYCKYLAVDDIWIPLAESMLIEIFRPLWNTVLDGFGNHPVGGRREAQYRSDWDILHPGRIWAARLPQGPHTVREIRSRIRAHLISTP